MRKINSALRNLLVDEDDIDCEDYEYYYDDDSIEELDFNVRTYNCLRRAGITTVSQLKQMTVKDLKKVKNLGSKSLDEILQRVEIIGASNRVTHDVWFPSKYGLK